MTLILARSLSLSLCFFFVFSGNRFGQQQSETKKGTRAKCQVLWMNFNLRISYLETIWRKCVYHINRLKWLSSMTHTCRHTHIQKMMCVSISGNTLCLWLLSMGLFWRISIYRTHAPHPVPSACTSLALRNDVKMPLWIAQRVSRRILCYSKNVDAHLIIV